MTTIAVPGVLARVFDREDAALVVSISGGKDGQAMLVALARQHAGRGWRCGLFAIHADLGRAEWPQSIERCQTLCDSLGVFLKVVRADCSSWPLIAAWYDLHPEERSHV